MIISASSGPDDSALPEIPLPFRLAWPRRSDEIIGEVPSWALGLMVAMSILSVYKPIQNWVASLCRYANWKGPNKCQSLAWICDSISPSLSPSKHFHIKIAGYSWLLWICIPNIPKIILKIIATAATLWSLVSHWGPWLRIFALLAALARFF